MTWSDWSLELQRRVHEEPTRRKPYVIKSEDPVVGDPIAMIIGDSKGVYDNLDKEQPGDDRYSALQSAIIKEKMKALGAIARWLPHDKNPADALTKFRGAHAVPLMRLLTTGRFRLSSEDEELKKKAEAKAELGYVPRPKTGVRGALKAIQGFLKCAVTKEEYLLWLRHELCDVLDDSGEPGPSVRKSETQPD